MDDVVQQLAEIREALAELSGALARDVPRREVYTFAEAAQLLAGVSTKTLKRMEASGQILSVPLAGRRGIPRSEIERLSTPQPKAAAPRAPGGTRRAGRRSVVRESEAAKIRALTKR